MHQSTPPAAPPSPTPPPPVCTSSRTRPRAASSSQSGRQSSRGRQTTSEPSRSWRSSAVRGSGVISSWTCSIAAGSSAPIDARSTASPRRSTTALVRRFCSSSSSRNAYGRAVRISCASTDGSVVSTECTATAPASMRSSRSRTPSTSSASCSVSSIVWRTRRWSGISIGPVTFSWHAAACGNTAAIRSSASMRWIGGGLRFPPRNRSTSSARLRFQRQRDRNIGESRMAWRSVSSMVALLT